MKILEKESSCMHHAMTLIKVSFIDYDINEINANFFGWLNRFNVGLERCSELLPMIWDSHLRVA